MGGTGIGRPGSPGETLSSQSLRQRRSGRLTRFAGCLTAIALVTAGLGVSSTGASAQSDTTAVTFPGSPLTVYVGPRGECQSSYLVKGEVAGNFYYGGNQVGDCGFFLAFPKTGTGQPSALKEKTFGFDGAAGPSLESL